MACVSTGFFVWREFDGFDVGAFNFLNEKKSRLENFGKDEYEYEYYT